MFETRKFPLHEQGDYIVPTPIGGPERNGEKFMD